MKPTLYWVTGTHSIADVFGTGVIDMGDASASFPGMIDSSVWNVVPITYAGSYFPLFTSGAEGVTNLVAQMNATPGYFGLAGMSQGAWVTSRVLAEINSGALQARKRDFVAGVTWGNPMRMVDHTWPGHTLSGAFDVPGSTSGGHGCLDASQRMTSVPATWFDYCNDLDPITSVGDSSVGALWTKFCMWFSANYLSGDILTAAFAALSTAFTDLGALAALIQDVYNDIGSARGHNYLVPAPGAPAGSPTMMQLGATYLNTIGAQAQADMPPAWTALSAGMAAPPP